MSAVQVARGPATELRPDPDQARDWLTGELIKPEYHQESWSDRLTRWLQRMLETASENASQLGAWGTFAGLVLLLIVAVAVIWLVSRVRSNRPTARERVVALPTTRISAQDHRAAATRALAENDPATAVVEAFRAAAMRLVESEQVLDRPGATATELVAEMSRVRPDLGDAMREAAHLFDSVHYGDLRPDAAQAARILDLDDRLQGARR